MVFTVSSPLLYTIAFTGVATGIINAQLALMAAGIMRISGSTSIATAALAKIGISNVAVAVFDVISVTKLTDKHNTNTNKNKGNTANPVKPWPNNSLNPDAEKACAKQIPQQTPTAYPMEFAARYSSQASNLACYP